MNLLSRSIPITLLAIALLMGLCACGSSAKKTSKKSAKAPAAAKKTAAAKRVSTATQPPSAARPAPAPSNTPGENAPAIEASLPGRNTPPTDDSAPNSDSQGDPAWGIPPAPSADAKVIPVNLVEFSKGANKQVEKYAGAWVEVSGAIYDIDVMFSRNKKWQTSVVINTGEQFNADIAVCIPGPEFKDAWNKMGTGTRVTVRGALAEQGGLWHCQFVKIEGPACPRLTAEELVAEYQADPAKTAEKYHKKLVVLTGKIATEFADDEQQPTACTLQGTSDLQLPVVSDKASRKDFFGKLKSGEQVTILGQCKVDAYDEKFKLGIVRAVRPDFVQPEPKAAAAQPEPKASPPATPTNFDEKVRTFGGRKVIAPDPAGHAGNEIPPAPKADAKVIPVQLAEFSDGVTGGSAEFLERFDHSWVEMTGVVEGFDIGVWFHGGWWSRVTLGDGSGTKYVFCAPDRELKQPWKKLGTGSRVTLRGTLGKSGGLWHCRLVKAEGEPCPEVTAELLAAEFTADPEKAREKYHGKLVVVSGVVEADFQEVAFQTLGSTLKGSGDVNVAVQNGLYSRYDFFKDVKARDRISVVGNCEVNAAGGSFKIGVLKALRTDFME